jgi:hypothetical protein
MPLLLDASQTYSLQNRGEIKKTSVETVKREVKMNPTTGFEKEERHRLEDSYSLPENQRIYPDDPYAFEHEQEILKKWHKRNDEKKLEEMLA